MLFKNTNQEADYSVNENAVFDEDTNMSSNEGGIIDDQALKEAFIADALDRMNDEDYKAYTESDEFKNLVEAGVVGRRSIVRMNRSDDLTRRIHLAAIQMAREQGDSDWEALRKNRINERRLLNKIYTKYSTRVRRSAIQNQKRLVKLNPSMFNFRNVGR